MTPATRQLWTLTQMCITAKSALQLEIASPSKLPPSSWPTILSRLVVALNLSRLVRPSLLDYSVLVRGGFPGNRPRVSRHLKNQFSILLPFSLSLFSNPSPSLPWTPKGKHWDNSCHGPRESKRREKRGQTVKKAGIQGIAEREVCTPIHTSKERNTHTHTQVKKGTHTQVKTGQILILTHTKWNVMIWTRHFMHQLCSPLCAWASVCLWNVWHRNYSEEVLLAE